MVNTEHNTDRPPAGRSPAGRRPPVDPPLATTTAPHPGEERGGHDAIAIARLLPRTSRRASNLGHHGGSAAAATPITAVRSADQLRQGRCSTLGSRSARASSAPTTPR